MPPKSFLKSETQIAINSLDKEMDESLYKGTKQEVHKLEKEKETLERSILAFEEASTIKVDSKSQRRMDYFLSEMKLARERFENEKKGAEEKYEKYRDYCNSQIELLSGKKVDEPERILRAKIQLRELNNKLEYKRLFLDSFDNAGKSSFVHILPEATWNVNPDLEASVMRELQMRRENPEMEL
jgi:hypothetical protein